MAEVSLYGSLAAATASIIAAATAWAQAIKVKRIDAASQERLKLVDLQIQDRANENLLRIEQLKIQSGSKAKAYDIASARVGPAIEALDLAWKLLQFVRDDLREISEHMHFAREDWSVLAASIDKNAELFRSMYRERGIMLPTSLRAIAHEAAGTLAKLQLGTRQIDPNPVVNSVVGNEIRMSEDEQTQFTKFRSRLQEFQVMIAEERGSLTEKEVNRILQSLSEDAGPDRQ